MIVNFNNKILQNYARINRYRILYLNENSHPHDVC